LKAATEPVTFTAACAIEPDYVYVAGKPDSVDPDAPFTRLFFLDLQRPAAPWVHHDLADEVCSVAVGPALGAAKRTYCALAKNGGVEFTWPGGATVEQIEGAGVAVAAPPVYGYVDEVRLIGGALFVCGGGGQIYRRGAAGWSPLAPQFLTAAEAPQAGVIHAPRPELPHHFTSIDGYAADDLYVAGHGGEIQHFDGEGWQLCPSSTDEILLRIRCAADGTVWACGFNGALLRGRAGEDFVDVSAYTDNTIFHDVCVFNGVPYLASNDGLFRFDGQRIEPVALDLAGGEASVLALDQKGGVLWVFGYRSLAAFDGTAWRHFEHPDNA